MKKSILAIALSVPISAFAVDATVVAVYPMHETMMVQRTVYETHEVCRNTSREAMGGIESYTNTIFGSVGGVLGTAAGVAIGSEFGSGSGRTGMKVVGGIVGNKIGNDIASSRQEKCEYKTIPIERTVPESYVTGYNIKVRIDDEYHNIVRDFRPNLGDVINVRVSVN